MRKLCFTIRMLALLVLAGWSSQALAAYDYQYTFGQPNYVVAPGQTIAVDVYLQETVSEGDTPWFTSANQGLFSGGVRVFFNEMPLPLDLAEVPSIASIIINPLFTDPTNFRNVQPGASAALTAAVLDPLSELITGTQLNATTSRILLGTLNFTAGLINDEVTHLLATDFNTVNPSSNENTVFNSSTFAALDLDSLILPGTATITTIPEPSTFVGLLLLGLASWYVGKLLRRKNLC